MVKEKVLRIRISEQDRADLDVVAKQNDVSASEFARVAINNRVKKAKSGKKTHKVKVMKEEVL